jgi:hypothetical protein
MSPTAFLISSMSLAQESPGAAQPIAATDWTLPAGVARRLGVGPGARWLRVSSGRVWLTMQGQPRHLAVDHWLGVGEQLWLPEGCEVVVEGQRRGPASFQLLVPPQACRADVGLACAWRMLLRWVLHNLRTARTVGPPEIACHSQTVPPCAPS